MPVFAPATVAEEARQGSSCFSQKLYSLIPPGTIIISLLSLSGIEMSEALRKKLEEEIRALAHELNHELPAELKKAIAHGDLSENAEYSAARQRQDYVRARLAQLGKRLSDIALVNFNSIPRDRVAFGSTVSLYDVSKG